MISCTDIYKSYGELTVLRGVDLSIAKGELVSIVGKSGAGKSTLLHILGTLEQQDKGKVLINDTDISRLSRRELAKFRNSNIGFVFQFHHLLPEFSALENVCIPSYIQGANNAKVRTRAKELLGYLGLAERFAHRPKELSGGEQQRVAIARALINQPAVIFADEPTGNLDSSTSDDLHKLFFQLRDDFEQTFVIVTHNEYLANLSDRKLEMLDGKVVKEERRVSE